MREHTHATSAATEGNAPSSIAPGRRALTDRFGPVRSAPLDPSLAAPLGDHFGADLSSVRVHSGGGVDAGLAGAGARAMAEGNDIFLGGDRSPALIAHEIAHVVQHREGRLDRAAAKSEGGDGGDPHEAEADRHAALLAPFLLFGGPAVTRPTRVRAKTDVNLRAAPSPTAARVGGLWHGDEADAIGKEGDWLRVQRAGAIAYVMAKFVEEVGPAHDAPAPAPAPAPPPVNAPAPAPGPSAPEVTIDQIIAFATQIGSPAAAELTLARTLFQQAARHEDDRKQEVGDLRTQLVASLGRLRAIAAQLPRGMMNDMLRPMLYQAANDLSPYYAQYGNDNDILAFDYQNKKGEQVHVGGVEFTCNVTSLAMALESLGKTTASYTGSWEKVKAAGKLCLGTDKVEGLRMPDFLQLATIAELMDDASEAAARAGRAAAHANITVYSFVTRLANRFASAEWKFFDRTRAIANGSENAPDADLLNNYGGGGVGNTDRRHAVTALADRENDDGQRQSDEIVGAGRLALHQDRIDQRMPLEQYRAAIVAQIGEELGGGAAVVVGVNGHYVRLQALHADHIVVDDPGNYYRADMKLTYEQARALGCFWLRIVIR